MGQHLIGNIKAGWVTSQSTQQWVCYPTKAVEAKARRTIPSHAREREDRAAGENPSNTHT